MNMLLAVLLLAVSGQMVDAYDTVCYGDFGCYTNAPPYGNTKCRSFGILPDDPSNVNARFFLDTRSQKNYEVYYDDMAGVASSTFNPSLQTRFIIHGYIDNGDVAWMEEMSDSFLAVKRENIIRVGWFGASFQINYMSAAVDTQIVGKAVAMMTNNMISSFGMSPDQFHCIGHSLGGQTCGYVGDGVNNLGRITGLDPAGPYFQGCSTTVRLDSTDAVFVDVIHSDAVDLSEFGFGTDERSGDVDFWPNGGRYQPGCDQNALSTIVGVDGLVDGTRDFVACNHIRAIKFFTESITTNCYFKTYPCANYDDFLAGKCLACDGTNCPQLGYHADEYANYVGSTYTYLETNPLSPFCEYMTYVEVALGSNSKTVYGGLYVTLYGASGATEQEQLGGDGTEYRLAPSASYGDMLYYDINPGNAFNIEKVKLLWEQEEIEIGRQYISVDHISVFVGSSQTTYTFCGDGTEMSELIRYTFYPC